MLERLVRQLGETLQADDMLSAYVLVDPMLREPFSEDLPQAESRDVWTIPVHHPLLKPEQRPRLIHLHPHDTHLLEASLALALSEQADPDTEGEQGFALGGWLLCAAPADALVRHLARCMNGGLSNEATPRLIRWADRRVMEWMWPALTPNQQAGLLGPMQCWCSLDRCGRLMRYEIAPGVVLESPSFSAGQWAHAGSNEAVQDLLRGWLRFAGALPEDYLQQASEVARTVISAGLSNRQDRVLLGAYVLQIHPRLITHPIVHSAIARALRGEVTLAQALDDIPDPEGWNAIRDELERRAGSGQSRSIAEGEELG
ncbi:DUF4123 domain-containing protein [Variovorax sp. LT1R20]|uniref:DUF4123 domain-containing protein n=1 Tax=Variovorax sp. LT1R20 TaxID=3443729 RepID=UPI003F471183